MEITSFDSGELWIDQQQRGLKRKDMTFMKEVMSLFNHPEKNKNIIHVTGTNGKGSTIAYMQTVLNAHGYSVARFVSPHLLHVSERFEINGKGISETDFVHFLNQIKALNIAFSQFEIYVLIFMLYIQKYTVDYVLMEVGIGGILDSTNFIHPIASVITSIGLDHTEMLGETIEEIAMQKAGIIKWEQPVFIGQLPQEASDIIKQVATKHQSALMAVDYTPHQENAFKFHWNNNVWTNGLIGYHQHHNAALALTVVQHVLKETFQIECAKQAIVTTKWAGRLEKVCDTSNVYLDGAHNEQGIRALVTTIEKQFQNQSVTVLFSALQRKDYKKMLALLTNVKVVVTTFDDVQAETPENLASAATQSVTLASDWKTFISTFKQMHHNDNHCLIVTGSLYFIAQVKEFLEKN